MKYSTYANICLYLVSPALPFVIWLFVHQIKKNQKPWIAIILLIICLHFYTGLLVCLK